jgi:CheY-like chemotaxis protein
MRAYVSMKYVLIAEDDPAVAQLISDEIAERLYVATLVVANGALVPEAIATRRPDLLILDLALPGLSGLDVFDIMRSDPAGQDVPVLFLTGSPDKVEPATDRTVGSTGPQRVIAKPFDIDELVEAVDTMLDGHKATAAA